MTGDGGAAAAAWSDLVARLGALGERIGAEPFPGDDHGYRHLARQLVMALQSEVEFSDPRRPALHRYEQPWLQWGGPNPDNVYERCAIDPAGTYVLRGDVRGLRQAIFSLVDGDMHLGKFGVFSEHTLDQFAVDGTGELVVTIAPVAPAGGGNWMATHDDARMLLIRQYQSDWERDVIATFTIERVDDGSTAAPSPSVAEGLGRAAAWIDASIPFWERYTSNARANTPHNAFTPPRTPPGGAPNIGYGACWWELGSRDAIVAEFDAPDADYWGWTIHTDTWLDSGEFADAPTSLNAQQVHVDTDGRVRMVVAHADPGVPNWIDIGDRPEGMIVYRYVGARTKPVPAAQVVALDEVRRAVPADHPTVSPAERAVALARRRAAVLRRR